MKRFIIALILIIACVASANAQQCNSAASQAQSALALNTQLAQFAQLQPVGGASASAANGGTAASSSVAGAQRFVVPQFVQPQVQFAQPQVQFVQPQVQFAQPQFAASPVFLAPAAAAASSGCSTCNAGRGRGQVSISKSKTRSAGLIGALTGR